jgi:N-acetylmuramoyl-L-alanine amidase
MGASNAVAEQVLTALRKLGPTHRGYVERANFVVLRSPDVPSILVETAFITNPTEEAKLKNPAHREKLASAILDGVDDYFRASPPPGTWFAANSGPSKKRAPLASRYVVNRGDTLSAIAQHHGLSIAQLREANDLDEDLVKPGEVLRIPSG